MWGVFIKGKGQENRPRLLVGGGGPSRGPEKGTGKFRKGGGWSYVSEQWGQWGEPVPVCRGTRPKVKNRGGTPRVKKRGDQAE